MKPAAPEVGWLSAHVDGVHATANSVPSLENDDLLPCSHELSGCPETCYPSAYDYDVEHCEMAQRSSAAAQQDGAWNATACKANVAHMEMADAMDGSNASKETLKFRQQARRG